MALATRPKPTVSHRKRQAQHHRYSKPYLKAYWPYLPMMAILGSGALINQTWAVADAAPSTSRLQALSGSNATWLTTAVLLIAAGALALFMIRHTLAFHRVVVRSEHFINEHPLLDIATVLVFTTGFLLAGSSVIR